MEIFRKMSFADSTGDAIPFYHEGKYHIFSLTSPPGTTVYPARLRTTWSHSVSDDLVHWEELPTALYPGEGDEPDASGVWTGSVIYGEGKYHAFYTGYCLTAEWIITYDISRLLRNIIRSRIGSILKRHLWN
jgi:beta-fructofuranosidase